MKKRVIYFGDNRLFGGVGEWGLVLTAWAEGTGKGVSDCPESQIVDDKHNNESSATVFHVTILAFKLKKNGFLLNL